MDPKGFSIEQIPGKGKGLVACFNIDIPKGTRIISEKPLFTTRKLSPVSLLETTIAKLMTLPKLEQREFLSLYNNLTGKHPFSGIMNTNALPYGAGSVSGIFPTTCFINHDCIPKVHHSWVENIKCETIIHAFRFIKAGEDITISYNDGSSASSRQALLKSAFGFDCNCSLCSLPPRDIQASDSRRQKIELLGEAIGDRE